MIRQVLEQTVRSLRRGAATTTGAWISVLQRVNQALGEGPVDTDPTLRELRRMLGLSAEPPDAPDGVPNGAQAQERLSDRELRNRFADLLERSQDPEPPDGTHPAFRSIIDEVTPDEARILRLLEEDGPQPVLSVTSAPLIGRGETTILENVTLVGERAGCHLPDAAPAYLDNLERLGLVRLLKEELAGNDDYDVIESRPEVASAEEHITQERSQRARMVRGNVRLSRLGTLLCDICLD